MGVISGGQVIGGASRRLAVLRATLVIGTDFVDLGSGLGTRQLTSAQGYTNIPVGARVVYARCNVDVACTGDTSAVITIGDGSDVDRYMTGTPSVFTTGDKAMGVPSGIPYHTLAIAPTVYIQSAANFASVNALGQVTIEIWYEDAG